MASSTGLVPKPHRPLLLLFALLLLGGLRRAVLLFLLLALLRVGDRHRPAGRAGPDPGDLCRREPAAVEADARDGAGRLLTAVVLEEPQRVVDRRAAVRRSELRRAVHVDRGERRRHYH